MAAETEKSLAQQLFGVVVEGVKEASQEIGVEMKRLGVQGTMELASALFNGSAFVPYGPGQYTPKQEHDVGIEGHEKEIQKEAPEQEQQMQRDGRSM
jgi:hypothetical protein